MFEAIFYPATTRVRKKRMEFLCASDNGPRLRLSARHSATFAAVLLAGCFLFPTVCSAQVKPIRRLLILYESSPSSPLPNLVDHGIQTALNNSPYLIEFHREYMETASFPDPVDQQMFRDYYIRKYQNRRPNVVIAVGPSPLQFMLETHEGFFAGVPVIFCLPNRISGSFMIDSDFTGVEGDIAPAETLAAALRLQPGTKHVVVVSGTSPFDRQQNAAVKDQLKSYESSLDISYLTNLAMPDLVERLKHLPSHTIVILGALGRDAAGTRFTLAESGPMVVAAANAPVFTLNDRALNHGEVGGDVSNSFEQGRIVGGMALRLLNGEKPRDIPAVKKETTYMFDWQALKRWGMKESDLPSGSIVLNRQPSFWEAYKKYALVVILVLIAQAAAIVALLWQQARKRKVEAELRKSEQKFSKAFRRSPLAFTLVSLVDYRFIEVNDTYEQYLGWRREETIGRTPLDLKIWVDTNQRTTFIEQLQAQGAVRNTELLFRKKDGRVWTGLVSSELIDFNGQPCALSLIADITARKEAEEALAGLSRKLVAVQEEERTRIARDLHDDINQRLAMLAVEIEQLTNNPPGSPVELNHRLSEVRERLTEVSTGVQSISHELHSPQLEYLGVVAALKSFCREFASRQSVKVDFQSDDVAQSPSHEVSLCLFRVLQEALHNATKYSQVRHFEVRLTCAGDQLDLTVADQGIGFDPETAMKEGGLGLVSMRERVRLVNGTIVIDSKPMSGATIHVRVPFGSENTSRRVAV
jgi:PAS domain S-box-containing protein